MSDESPYKPPVVSVGTKRAWRLRTWFMVGFVVVFVLWLVLINQFAFTDAGLARCKLWQYYLIEIGRSFQPRNLGPATGSGPGVLYVFAIHLAASCVGGLVALGIGLLSRRFKNVE